VNSPIAISWPPFHHRQLGGGMWDVKCTAAWLPRLTLAPVTLTVYTPPEGWADQISDIRGCVFWAFRKDWRKRDGVPEMANFSTAKFFREICFLGVAERISSFLL
jgi:hypothetical protein